jgi:hypothetical protein
MEPEPARAWRGEAAVSELVRVARMARRMVNNMMTVEE